MTISSLIEIPETLYNAVAKFTEASSDRDFNQVMQSALESFAIANGVCTKSEIDRNNARLSRPDNAC